MTWFFRRLSYVLCVVGGWVFAQPDTNFNKVMFSVLIAVVVIMDGWADERNW